MKKQICILMLVSLCIIMSACGSSKVRNIDNVFIDKNQKEQIWLDLYGNNGKMDYELLDAYITDSVEQVTKIVNGSPIYLEDEKGDVQIYDAYDILDMQTGKLADGCHLFVVEMRVTNIDAVYSEKDEFLSAYKFRADNITLCYVDKENNVCMYENVDYYSEKNDDDDIEWSTYNLKPGESITYKVGFIIGEYVQNQKTMQYIKVDDTKELMLSNMSGDPNGQFYQINWESR